MVRYCCQDQKKPGWGLFLEAAELKSPLTDSLSQILFGVMKTSHIARVKVRTGLYSFFDPFIFHFFTLMFTPIFILFLILGVCLRHVYQHAQAEGE